MSVITSNNYAGLGMNGVQSFFKAIDPLNTSDKDGFDTIHTIDDAFLEKIKSMETYEFGFSDMFKETFVKLIEQKKGEKLMITNDWLISWEDKRSQYLMNVVKALNEGLELQEAIDKVKKTLQDTEEVEVNV
jgi:hypothetical protein